MKKKVFIQCVSEEIASIIYDVLTSNRFSVKPFKLILTSEGFEELESYITQRALNFLSKDSLCCDKFSYSYDSMDYIIQSNKAYKRFLETGELPF